MTGAENLVNEIFSPASFWRKQLKTQVLSEGKCYFVALLWLNISCMAFQAWLGNEIGNVNCIQSLAVIFRFSHNMLAEDF